MSEGLLPPFLGYFSHVVRELLRAILDTLLFKPLVVGFTIATQLASIYKERVIVVRVVTWNLCRPRHEALSAVRL